MTGHVHLHAGNHPEARAALTAAFDRLLATARRARILVLTDLAMVELQTSTPPELFIRVRCITRRTVTGTAGLSPLSAETMPLSRCSGRHHK